MFGIQSNSKGIPSFIEFNTGDLTFANNANIPNWTDRARNLVASQATTTSQPTYSTLGSGSVRVLNNDTKFLTFNLPANSGISGSAYFGFANSVFACNISIPDSANSTAIEIGRYGDYLTGIIIYDIFTESAQESDIIATLQSKLIGTASKSADSFFLRNTSRTTRRLVNYITRVLNTSIVNQLTNIDYCWQNCSQLLAFDILSFPAVISAAFTWQYCTGLTSFPSINLPNATKLDFSWANCTGLTVFPALNLPNATRCEFAWDGCTGLTSFPAVTFSVLNNCNYAWRGCTGLTSFPSINLASVTTASAAWVGCRGLTSTGLDPSFPAINFPVLTLASFTWQACTGFKVFPNINLSAVTNCSFGWDGCTGLTSFPPISFPALTNATYAWRNCTSLTSFPSINLSAVTDASFGWDGCAKLTSFPAINFSALNKADYAWRNCVLLKSFGSITLPVATTVDFAWQNTGLTEFPVIDLPNLTSANTAWQNCKDMVVFPRLNFPKLVNVNNAWNSCILNQVSVDNILISLAASLANNPTKTGLVGTNALTNNTDTFNAIPGNEIRTLTNSWETNLKNINEVGYNFSGGITGQQAKAWLSSKGWTIQTN